MKKSSLHLLRALFLSTLTAVSCAQEETTRQKGHYPPNTEQEANAEFIRFTSESEGEGVLETAIVTYKGEDGEVVELVSAVHIADMTYYKRLEELFKTYDSLLYEMVKAKDAVIPAPKRTGLTESTSIVGGFQRFMRDSLDLEFQLDAIDYRAKNFVHADLDHETFEKLSEERGESLLTLLLRSATAQYQRQAAGESKSDPFLGIKMLAAFFQPDSARSLKFLLAKELQNMEEILAGLGGGEDGKGSVILTERNKELMRVLRDRLARGEKKIGVFYGGAHMPDVEQRIFAEIGLKRSGVRWERAWLIEKKPTKKKDKGDKDN